MCLLVGYWFWTPVPTGDILNRSISSQWYLGAGCRTHPGIASSRTCMYKLKVRDKGSSSRLFLNLHLVFPAMSPTVNSTYQRTGRERKIQPHISLQGTLTGGPGDWVKVMSIKGKQPFTQRRCPGRELFAQFSAN